jgi:VanZ family protein
VYGSLYPWHFVPQRVPGNPLDILLHAWHPGMGRFLLRDTVVNISIYVPLGFAAHLSLGKARLPGFRVYGPVVLATLLSAAVELMQLYTPNRDTSLLDLITNVAGAALGVALAAIFEKIYGTRLRHAYLIPADRGALMLIFCRGAWLLFPFFPIFGHHELVRKLSVFADSPVFDAVGILSAAALWYVTGLLLSGAGIRRAPELVALSILAIPAQLLIVERQPVISDLLGAILGFSLFAWRSRTRPVTRAEAWAFAAVIAMRGLAPFHFAPVPASFTWIPFGGMLEADWQFAVMILLEKIFWYTSAVWLLRASGMRLRYAITAVAAVLGAIETAQVRLPGRVAESTDPILAVLMGFVLFILFRETGTRSQSAG